MFNIEVKKDEGVFHVSASGFISRNEAISLVAALKENFSKINEKDYSLIIDSREVKPAAPDTLDVLQEVMDLYLKAEFKMKFLISPENVITNSQNKRMDKINFHEVILPVASYEEALQAIKKA